MVKLNIFIRQAIGHWMTGLLFILGFSLYPSLGLNQVTYKPDAIVDDISFDMVSYNMDLKAIRASVKSMPTNSENVRKRVAVILPFAKELFDAGVPKVIVDKVITEPGWNNIHRNMEIGLLNNDVRALERMYEQVHTVFRGLEALEQRLLGGEFQIHDKKYYEEVKNASTRYAELLCQTAEFFEEYRQVSRGWEYYRDECKEANRFTLEQVQRDIENVKSRLETYAGMYEIAYWGEDTPGMLDAMGRLERAIESQHTGIRADLSSLIRDMLSAIRKAGPEFPINKIMEFHAPVPDFPLDQIIPKEEYFSNMFNGPINRWYYDYWHAFAPLEYDYLNIDIDMIYQPLTWPVCTPNGDFDFSNIDRLIELQKKHGYRSLIGDSLFRIWNFRNYLYERYGAAAFFSQPTGWGIIPNIFHPGVREFCQRRYETIGRYYNDNPAVIAVATWIEPGIPLFYHSGLPESSYIEESFREYLKEKFHSIDRLNAEWDSDHFAFSKIFPPETPLKEVTPITVEFQLFFQKSLNDFLHMANKAASSVNTNHPVLTQTLLRNLLDMTETEVKFQKWLEKGGKIISIGPPGIYDLYSRQTNTLNNLFG